MRRSLGVHYLFAAPGAGMFGAAVFAVSSWLVVGAGISPVVAGTLAMLAFLPGAFIRLIQPEGGYGSLSGTVVVFLGCAMLALGASLLRFIGAPDHTAPRLLLIGASVLVFSYIHSVLSASAADRLDSVLPVRRREPFREKIGLRTAAVSVASLLFAGVVMDVSGPERFIPFAIITAVSLLFLFQSALFLRNIPPVSAPEAIPECAGTISDKQALGKPSPRLTLLDIAFCVAAGIPAPFLLAFMAAPGCLGLHLSTVAFYVAFFPAFASPGLIFWRWAGERFGSRPLLQFTIPLLAATLLPLTLITRGNAFLLAPILGLAGFLFSGVSAGMNRAWGTDPAGRSVLPGVYAAHSLYGDIAFTAAPFAAGLALYCFGGAAVSRFGDIRLVFLASAAALILTFPLLGGIDAGKGMSLVRVLRMIARGNPFLFAWNALQIRRARSEEDRGRVMGGLGRSGNPLAIPYLLEALGDPSPEVRGNAISALGKTGGREAVPALMQELEDPESDMRSEAAEALGKIGGREALSPLLSALGDRDIRLRNTAITALAEIGGTDIRELLFEMFVMSYDTDVFPTLADSLSRLGVTTIVEPVMRRLGEYESPMLRLQLLNAVCRALGAGNTFYRILSRHEYARVDEVNRLIRQARRHVRRFPLFRRDTASGVNRILESIAASYRAEDHQTFLRSVWEFMAYMQLIVPDITSPGNETRVFGCGDGSPLRPYIEAVNRFLVLKESEDIRDEGMVFLVICINCMFARCT